MGNVLVSSSGENRNPVCKCCDDFVKYVLNGYTSECGLSKGCTRKIEMVKHIITQEIDVQQICKCLYINKKCRIPKLGIGQ